MAPEEEPQRGTVIMWEKTKSRFIRKMESLQEQGVPIKSQDDMILYLLNNLQPPRDVIHARMIGTQPIIDECIKEEKKGIVEPDAKSLMRLLYPVIMLALNNNTNMEHLLKNIKRILDTMPFKEKSE